MRRQARQAGTVKCKHVQAHAGAEKQASKQVQAGRQAQAGAGRRKQLHACTVSARCAIHKQSCTVDTARVSSIRCWRTTDTSFFRSLSDICESHPAVGSAGQREVGAAGQRKGNRPN